MNKDKLVELNRENGHPWRFMLFAAWLFSFPDVSFDDAANFGSRLYTDARDSNQSDQISRIRGAEREQGFDCDSPVLQYRRIISS
jgi:hypothetical protein